MEPESSLSHSQQPATCLYPEPGQSSPSPHFISWRSIFILSSSNLHLGLPSDSLSTKRCLIDQLCRVLTVAANFLWSLLTLFTSQTSLGYLAMQKCLINNSTGSVTQLQDTTKECGHWNSSCPCGRYRGIVRSGGIVPLIPHLNARWRWVDRFTLQLLYLRSRSPLVPIK